MNYYMKATRRAASSIKEDARVNTPRKEGPRKDFEEWGIDSATRPSSVI